MLYLFEVFYQIEISNSKKGRNSTKTIKQEIKEHIYKISFVLFKEDGDFKTALNEYGNGYKLFDLFYELKEKELFASFLQLIIKFSMSKQHKDDPHLIMKKFVSLILKLKIFRTEIYEISVRTLRNQESGFYDKNLFELTKTYLEFIGENREMTIHAKGQIIGKPIGFFASKLGNSGKDLLFNLRNIKRHSQFVEYFRDLHFRILKDSDEARFKQEFYITLDEIIADEVNWQTLRDYISIYAIQNYRSTEYNREKGE